jgi:hypothetical protein
MTESSSPKKSDSQPPTREPNASLIAHSEPLQLDLFERWLGTGGWIKETPHESRPSRDFVLTLARKDEPTSD